MGRGGVTGGKWQTAKGPRSQVSSPHLPGIGFTPMSTRNVSQWCFLCGQSHDYHEPTKVQRREGR